MNGGLRVTGAGVGGYIAVNPGGLRITRCSEPSVDRTASASVERGRTLFGGPILALAAARITLEREVLFYQYLQWIAEGQWQAARRASRPVAIFGDFPFLVTGDSADVWKRQDEFLLEATVGAPPDAFSETGQDWGLPPCNWEVMSARGDEWIRQRARRMAALFDGYRVDHLVGFYRTYVRPLAGKPYFLPGTEPAQLAQGERLMRIFLDSGAHVVVEDLGNVPTFVRESIARLGLPGYRVLRWAKDWDSPGDPFPRSCDLSVRLGRDNRDARHRNAG